MNSTPCCFSSRYRCVFSIFMVAGIVPIFPRVTSPTNASTPTWAVECRLSMDGAPQSARVACCRMEMAMAAAVGDLPVVHEAREAAQTVFGAFAKSIRKSPNCYAKIAVFCHGLPPGAKDARKKGFSNFCLSSSHAAGGGNGRSAGNKSRIANV